MVSHNASMFSEQSQEDWVWSIYITCIDHIFFKVTTFFDKISISCFNGGIIIYFTGRLVLKKKTCFFLRWCLLRRRANARNVSCTPYPTGKKHTILPLPIIFHSWQFMVDWVQCKSKGWEGLLLQLPILRNYLLALWIWQKINVERGRERAKKESVGWLEKGVNWLTC